jgi:hypothetical protein
MGQQQMQRHKDNPQLSKLLAYAAGAWVVRQLTAAAVSVAAAVSSSWCAAAAAGAGGIFPCEWLRQQQQLVCKWLQWVGVRSLQQQLIGRFESGCGCSGPLQ